MSVLLMVLLKKRTPSRVCQDENLSSIYPNMILVCAIKSTYFYYGYLLSPLQNCLSVIDLKSVNIFLWTKKGKERAKKSLLLYQDFVKKNAYKLNRQEFGEATKMTYKNEHNK